MEEELKSEILHLNQIIIKLQEKMDKQNNKIKRLEEFFSCNICGEIDDMYFCYSCARKVCNDCKCCIETKDYTGDITRILCKWCK